jgi:uncharacterized protein YceK
MRVLCLTLALLLTGCAQVSITIGSTSQEEHNAQGLPKSCAIDRVKELGSRASQRGLSP